MKTFTKKLMLIAFTIYGLSLLIGPVLHVGDTTITQEASKNYNGYFSVHDEQKLIDYGFYYIPFDEISQRQSSYLLNSSAVNEGIFHVFTMPYLIQESNYWVTTYGPILASAYQVTYDPLDYGYIDLIVYDINGNIIVSTDGYVDDVSLYIYGYSNYEVTP